MDLGFMEYVRLRAIVEQVNGVRKIPLPRDLRPAGLRSIQDLWGKRWAPELGSLTQRLAENEWYWESLPEFVPRRKVPLRMALGGLVPRKRDYRDEAENLRVTRVVDGLLARKIPPELEPHRVTIEAMLRGDAKSTLRDELARLSAKLRA